MEWRRTFCLYHPSEVITNFCRQKSCLMPLCPTCIRQHSQYHAQSSTKPQYFNIYEVLQDVDGSLKTSIENLEQDKQRNGEIMKKIKSVENILKEKLKTVKDYILQLLEHSFDELQIELQTNLSKINVEQGLHSLSKAEKIDEKLSMSIYELNALREGLKSEKLMGSAILFLKDKQPEAFSTHTSLIGYLEANQSYTPKIDFNKEAKNQILFNLSRLIRIEGKREPVESKYRSRQASSTIFRSRMNRDQQVRNQKYENSYTPEKSTAYFKATNHQGFAGFNNNSPYRQRLNKKMNSSLQKDFVKQTDSYRPFYGSTIQNDSKIKKRRRQNEYIYEPMG